MSARFVPPGVGTGSAFVAGITSGRNVSTLDSSGPAEPPLEPLHATSATHKHIPIPNRSITILILIYAAF
jgi:hypothetical protein